MLWATDGERGPFHAEMLRAAGLPTTDRCVALVLHPDGTYESYAVGLDEHERVAAEITRLRPDLEEREWVDPDRLWDFD